MRVRATRLRRLRIRKAVGHATFAVALLAAGMLYLALEKNVTLIVDGHPQAIRTLSGNVGQLLSVQGITLEPGDLVEPPPATELADGMMVVVDLAGAPVPAREGLSGVGAWVVEGVGGPFLRILLTERVVSADAPVGPSRIVGARVVVKGKVHDVLTNATTVRELLSAMGIRPDGNDRVLPPPSAPLHANGLVRYLDVEVRNERVETPIPFATETIYSGQLAPGAVRILRHGVPGVMLRTYRVRVVDGKVMSRTLIGQRVESAAVAARRMVGLPNVTHGTQIGEASWYYAPGSGLTAAHPTLPFGTVVTVTNLDNGRSVTVVINDRGPFGGRIIDLSPEAFSAIASLGQGVAHVRLTW